MTCPTSIDTATVFDLVVIGGGSAGLAAAVSAKRCGLERVLVVEREEYLGGVLLQCVHDGFGLSVFGELLTGPEYAQRWITQLLDLGVEVACATTVLSIMNDRDGDCTASTSAPASTASAPDLAPACALPRYALDVVGIAVGGRSTLFAKSVIVATGCRERTRGQMMIPGSRPSGVMTAGCAQYMVNVENRLPGDKAVILGSGDIGLIMARRLVLEGCEVRLVLGQEATGLLRNHIRCIEEFDIPIRYGWGLASIHGHGQLKGVTIAPLREDGSFDLQQREYLRCNLLLIACGLIPEREVLAGFVPHEDRRVGDISSVIAADTTVFAGAHGVFVCGNASSPHDLVDQVSVESIQAGIRAAQAVLGEASVVPADIATLAALKVSEPKGRMKDIADCATGLRPIVCSVCPKSCLMYVATDGGIEGAACKRGESFARLELQDPRRLFTGTVRVCGGVQRLVPVRTATEVPRSVLLDVARACKKLHVIAPVRQGDVVASNIANTSVALVASADVDAKPTLPSVATRRSK